jgi:hypothetical protein
MQLTSQALGRSRKCSKIVPEDESPERTHQCGRNQALVQLIYINPSLSEIRITADDCPSVILLGTRRLCEGIEVRQTRPKDGSLARPRRRHVDAHLAIVRHPPLNFKVAKAGGIESQHTPPNGMSILGCES